MKKSGPNRFLTFVGGSVSRPFRYVGVLEVDAADLLDLIKASD
jgi:hypothetical protein